MLNKRYQDTMDQTRTLVVAGDASSTHYKCKVYWDLTAYGGMVNLPKHLFTQEREGLLGRIGFVAVQ